jgi:sulfonate transport system ATP-binding protein
MNGLPQLTLDSWTTTARSLLAIARRLARLAREDRATHWLLRRIQLMSMALASIDVMLPVLIYLSVQRSSAMRGDAASFTIAFVAVVALRAWLAEWRSALLSELAYQLERLLVARGIRTRLLGPARPLGLAGPEPLPSHLDLTDACRFQVLVELELPSQAGRLLLYPLIMAAASGSALVLLVLPFGLVFLAQRLALARHLARFRHQAAEERIRLSTLLEDVERHGDGLRFIAAARYVWALINTKMEDISAKLRQTTQILRRRMVGAYLSLVVPYLVILVLIVQDLLPGRELLLLPLNMLFLQLWQVLENISSNLAQCLEALTGAGRVIPSDTILRDSVPTSPSGPVEVELAGLTVGTESGRLILANVESRLRAGRITVLTGGNGCGKSTLCRLIAGIDKADSGSISVNGQAANDAARRAAVMLVPQDGVILRGSIAENLLGLMAEAKPTLVEWGLIGGEPYRDGSTAAASLSGGERQRLAITRALAHKPAVLILDETLGHQDPWYRQRIWERLRLAASTTTILLVSHDPADQALADTVLHLADGKITTIHQAAEFQDENRSAHCVPPQGRHPLHQTPPGPRARARRR